MNCGSFETCLFNVEYSSDRQLISMEGHQVYILRRKLWRSSFFAYSFERAYNVFRVLPSHLLSVCSHVSARLSLDGFS